MQVGSAVVAHPVLSLANAIAVFNVSSLHLVVVVGIQVLSTGAGEPAFQLWVPIAVHYLPVPMHWSPVGVSAPQVASVPLALACIKVILAATLVELSLHLSAAKLRQVLSTGPGDAATFHAL